ncbi:MAG TPA: hypothetical protein VF576_10170 [Rubricoccaceae bacterium]|jgi:hypothetical protein
MRRTLPLVVALSLAACAARPTETAPDAGGPPTYPGVAGVHRAPFLDPTNRVAADSGLVYEYGACVRYTFDSVHGTLVRDQRMEPGDRTGPTGLPLLDTARVSLTPDQTRAVFAEAERIGLWGYPEDVVDTVAETDTVLVVVPSGSHRLDVRRGGRSALVRWTAEVQSPLSPAASRLRALGHQIESYVDGHPAVRALPEPTSACL